MVRNPPSAPPRVVTLTKLVEEARIALVSRGATAAATGPLDRAALRAALEWLLDQMLVADEAARLQLDEVAARGRGRRAAPLPGAVRRRRRRTSGSSQRAELTEDELARDARAHGAGAALRRRAASAAPRAWARTRWTAGSRERGAAAGAGRRARRGPRAARGGAGDRAGAGARSPSCARARTIRIIGRLRRRGGRPDAPPRRARPAPARSRSGARALEDVDRVVEIEKDGFLAPVVARAHRARARPRLVAGCSLARGRPRAEPVVGYIVFWLVHDEVHVLNVATALEARRRGVGRALMEAAEREGRRRGARLATLEVRRSNDAGHRALPRARLPAGRRPAELLRRGAGGRDRDGEAAR